MPHAPSRKYVSACGPEFRITVNEFYLLAGLPRKDMQYGIVLVLMVLKSMFPIMPHPSCANTPICQRISTPTYDLAQVTVAALWHVHVTQPYVTRPTVYNVRKEKFEWSVRTHTQSSFGFSHASAFHVRCR